MYYLLDNDPDQRYEENEIDDLIETCYPDDYYEDDDEGFRDYLNEEYGYITIYGEEFSAAEVLEAMNEDVYENRKEDWVADQLNETRDDAGYTLRHIRAGSYEYVGNFCVYAYEDDAPEEEMVGITEEMQFRLEEMTEKEHAEQKEDELRAQNFESLFQVIQNKQS